MATPKVYVICDQNCKFESMTKEQILAAIMQAINEGTVGDVDAGFITTIKTINGQPLRFFYGEQSAYDELSEEDKENLLAIITNDTVNEAIKNLGALIEELKRGLEEGSFISKYATNAGYADNAGNAGYATKSGSADNATNATNAGYAANAGYAGSAGKATDAQYATKAGSANNATNATNAGYAATADCALSIKAKLLTTATITTSSSYAEGTIDTLLSNAEGLFLMKIGSMSCLFYLNKWGNSIFNFANQEVTINKSTNKITISKADVAYVNDTAYFYKLGYI